MYRALYRFNSTDDQALSFEAGDQFTVMDTTDNNWWLVQNGFGQVGYAPTNYITSDDAAHSEVMKSVDRAIEAIHTSAAAAGGAYTQAQRENLQKLVQHRKSIANSHRKSGSESLPKQPIRPAPTAPPGNAGTNQQNEPSQQAATNYKHGQQSEQEKANANPKRRSVKVKAAPLPPTEQPATSPTMSHMDKSPPAHAKPSGDRSPTVHEGSSVNMATSAIRHQESCHNSHSSVNIAVPDNIGAELLERVRRDTGLSYDKCVVAMRTILGHIQDRVPPVKSVMDSILKQVVQPETRRSESLEGSHDAVRLAAILSEMESCKDDSQQRSWALHEDESSILTNLEELLSILNNANPHVCCQIISRNNCEALDTLVVYYQMEPRVSIRLTLLQIFGAVCGLDAQFISHLLSTVLPVELSRDILSETKDIQKLMYSALVLTMILSMGENVAFNHYAQLNEDFVGHLLDIIDCPHAADTQERLTDLYVNLLLAFNLHFEIPSENLVMKTLAVKGTAKTFTEKVMLLVNRGDDPVRIFAHEHKPPNAVLKIMADVYSNPSTSLLLYTNDARVLIDIIVRQLSDLSPGDKLRTEYLSLIHLMIRNSDYREHQYRQGELQQCFITLRQEEGIDSEMDQLIVKEIWKEFPDLFNENVYL